MGEVFAGRYELVDPIGRGGAGAVWRAWDQRRRRYVAAKVLQQSDAHALLRFVREQAMRIDHPHVLAPASWAADDDKVLFTMELVHGGSLSHLIGDYGPLPPRYVCVLIDQLLSGLHAVHAEGIVHRDIKPANILLEATGTGVPHVRLSDFGIAMRQGEPRLTETDFVVGTPGYFAPEQMMGAKPDVPADLYAVGLVALYLLGGQKPDSRAITERFLAGGVPRAPVGVPEPLWQVIAALLQPDPRARFRTATGARKALAGAVELLPEPPPGEEPVEIFDQIGPLPEGFGPQGPLSAVTGGAPAGGAGPAPGAVPAPVPTPTAVPVPAAAPAPGSGPVSPPAPSAPPQQAQQAQQTQAQDPAYVSPTTGYPLAAPAHPPTRTDVPGPAAPQQAAPVTPTAPAAPVAGFRPPLPAGPGAEGTEGTEGAPATATAGAALPARTRKPGPPPKVVIPVLVLAAICFAVGIYALASG